MFSLSVKCVNKNTKLIGWLRGATDCKAVNESERHSGSSEGLMAVELLRLEYEISHRIAP